MKIDIASTQDVRHALIERREIALLDLRDEASFAEGHPLFAASLPLGRLELEIYDRVPRLATRVVIYDEDGTLVEAAMSRLETLGYSNVACLKDGVSGWQADGGEIFRDVNVPSKAFGELVEARRHTPSLSADEVQALIEGGADLVVLDARRPEEYRTMSVPTAISVPGAELVCRIGAIAPRTETLVVVNCAGRTRSIIGTQSLVNAGIANRVAALRNGTIGWLLAGHALEHGQTRWAPPVDAQTTQSAATAARAVADRAGVQRVTAEGLDAFVADDTRTTYRFDVRMPEEYTARHPAGFRGAPGGQLVQETDVFAPVRGARIVLWDDKAVRADMTASWLAQMGWEVYVLESASRLVWATGSWQPRSTPVPPVAGQLDNSQKRYKRPYEGTDNPRTAMQAYLEWEFGLVEQLDRDGTHGFQVI